MGQWAALVGQAWAFSKVQKVCVLPRMAAPLSPATLPGIWFNHSMCHLHKPKPLLDLPATLIIPQGSVAMPQGSAQKFIIKMGREGKTEDAGLATGRLWDLWRGVAQSLETQHCFLQPFCATLPT